jgi:hypothetical protein
VPAIQFNFSISTKFDGSTVFHKIGEKMKCRARHSI